jgi:ubiquitin-conjugating enzyme E2 M
MSRVSRVVRAQRTNAGSACDIRLQWDLDELKLSGVVSLSFPDSTNLKVFIVRLSPETGRWKGGRFDFEFFITPDLPMERPGVRILTRTWHPNISEDGTVCLSILKDNYLPIMTSPHLIAGPQFLFNEPNPQSPLNTDAATMLQTDADKFQAKVEEYIRQYCPR